MGLTLKVEYEPEDPSKLAIQLAEALNAASTNQIDADAFAQAERAERTKAMDMRTTIKRVQEHRKQHGAAPRRRMDPLAEYDLAAMELERTGLLARADELRVKSAAHAHEAERQRAVARDLQMKIRRVRK